MNALSTIIPIDEESTPAETVRHAHELFGNKLVMSTSFGIQSAVLLHIVTRQVPDIPVIWIDTGYLPTETYRYAERLRKELDLKLHVYQSTLSPAHMEALHGRLWESGKPEDLDRYHWLRKLEPMQRALWDLGASAWLSGIRRNQTAYRETLPAVTMQWGVLKIHPILSWTDDDVERYIAEHKLIRHPLQEEGFMSVGDAQLSSPPHAPAESDQQRRDGSTGTGRSGRFNGLREECGLHVYDPASSTHRAAIDIDRLDSL